jgi:hypothetical protein
MSGYTPVFDSIFQGSLCGKYPDLPVWLVLLAMQQWGGVVDAHPSYISMVSGIPQPDIEAAITRFCQPDPSSRTPDNDGRRLEPLEGRGFGWRILNHRIYREKARKQAYDEQRTESGADAARKRQLRQVPRSPAQSRDLPLSETETKTDTNSEKSRKPASRATAIPEPFDLTEERKAYADKTLPNVDGPALLEAFKDHHRAKGTTAKDWDASWRTWVRNAIKWGYPMLPLPPQVRGRREPTPEQLSEAQRKAAEDNCRQLEKALGSALR